MTTFAASGIPSSRESTWRRSRTTRWHGWCDSGAAAGSGKASTILAAASASWSCRTRGSRAPRRQSSDTRHVARQRSPRKRSTASGRAGMPCRLASGLGVVSVGSKRQTTAETSSVSWRVNRPVSNRHQSHVAVGRVNRRISRWLWANEDLISWFQSAPAAMLTPDTKHSIFGLIPSSACCTATARAWSSCLWLTKMRNRSSANRATPAPSRSLESPASFDGRSGIVDGAATTARRQQRSLSPFEPRPGRQPVGLTVGHRIPVRHPLGSDRRRPRAMTGAEAPRRSGYGERDFGVRR